jgi:hypothetical protein
MAKFVLQLEIEAPINTENPNFPKEVYAVEELCEHLKQATLQRLDYIIMALKDQKGEENSNNERFIKEQNRFIDKIKDIYPTIKLVEIKA